jgi:hypothetical protein
VCVCVRVCFRCHARCVCSLVQGVSGCAQSVCRCCQEPGHVVGHSRDSSSALGEWSAVARWGPMLSPLCCFEKLHLTSCLLCLNLLAALDA